MNTPFFLTAHASRRLILVSAGMVLLSAACKPASILPSDTSRILEQAAATSAPLVTIPSDVASVPSSDAVASNGEPRTESGEAAPGGLAQLDRNTFVEDDQTYYISQLLPLDGIPPIYEPAFVPGRDATYFDDELVIGVELDGEAKAYPITLLRSREMVNDQLAGTPILVTW